MPQKRPWALDLTPPTVPLPQKPPAGVSVAHHSSATTKTSACHGSPYCQPHLQRPHPGLLTATLLLTHLSEGSPLRVPPSPLSLGPCSLSVGDPHTHLPSPNPQHHALEGSTSPNLQGQQPRGNSASQSHPRSEPSPWQAASAAGTRTGSHRPTHPPAPLHLPPESCLEPGPVHLLCLPPLPKHGAAPPHCLLPCGTHPIPQKRSPFLHPPCTASSAGPPGSLCTTVLS